MLLTAIETDLSTHTLVRMTYSCCMSPSNPSPDQLDLLRIAFSKNLIGCNPMIVGIDVVNEGRLSIVGMTATYTNCLTQHFSNQMRIIKLRFKQPVFKRSTMMKTKTNQLDPENLPEHCLVRSGCDSFWFNRLLIQQSEDKSSTHHLMELLTLLDLMSISW